MKDLTRTPITLPPSRYGPTLSALQESACLAGLGLIQVDSCHKNWPGLPPAARRSVTKVGPPVAAVAYRNVDEAGSHRSGYVGKPCDAVGIPLLEMSIGGARNVML